MAAPAITHTEDRTVKHAHGTTLRSPKPLAPSHSTSDFVYLGVLLGIPGSMLASVLTVMLMLSYGEGSQLFLWLGGGTLFALYFGIMGAAWIAEASES